MLKPVRDRAGRLHFGENPEVLRQERNLDRTMYLVRFEDGSTTFVFAEEIEILPSDDGDQGFRH